MACRFPFLLLLCMFAQAQSVISLHAGLIMRSEGAAAIDGVPLGRRSFRYRTLPNGAQLETNAGRAEILLIPGVFLWLGPQSTIRMVSDTLTDGRLEMVAGSAVIIAAGITDNDAIVITHGDSRVPIAPQSFLRLEAADRFTVSQGKSAEVEDVLTRWARQRFEAISQQNRRRELQAAARNRHKQPPLNNPRPYPSAAAPIAGRS